MAEQLLPDVGSEFDDIMKQNFGGATEFEEPFGLAFAVEEGPVIENANTAPQQTTTPPPGDQGGIWIRDDTLD